MTDVWVFDIDGTLASHDNRSPFDETKVATDSVITPVAIVCNALIKAGYKVIFLSGRTEFCRNETEAWLMFYLDIEPEDIELYMRSTGDRRGDDIIKKEIYDNYILPKYIVWGVFDDRMKVCRMLYENNLFVFNVNQGLKEF